MSGGYFTVFVTVNKSRHPKAGDFTQITLQKTFYSSPHTGSQGVLHDSHQEC